MAWHSGGSRADDGSPISPSATSCVAKDAHGSQFVTDVCSAPAHVRFGPEVDIIWI